MGTIAQAVRHQMLDAVCRNTAFAVPAIYAKLHLGAPGAAGTSNPSAMTTRIQATFGNAATARTIATTAVMAWAGASTAETHTNCSFWTDATIGTFLGDDDFTAAPVAVGEVFQVAIGGFTIDMSASNVSDGVVAALLNALCRNTSYVNAQVWVQLHTGAPGAAGTSNIATNNTRVQAVSWAAPSGGAIATSAAVQWASAPATETITHVSLWSASTAGNLLGTPTLAAPVNAVTGNLFQIIAGQLTLTIT